MADDTRSRVMHTYALYDPLRHWVKIGRSVDVEKRVGAIRHASGADLTLVATVPHDCEGELHAALRPARLNGEWFAVTDHLRTIVKETFGCDLPPQRLADAEAATDKVVRSLEKAWNIPLVPPSAEWFATIITVLEDEYGVHEDHTVVGLSLFDRWPEWFVAVGGSVEHGELLGIVLADRPRPPAMDQLLRSFWWAVDSYTALEIAVSSDPPEFLAESLIAMSAA